MGLKVLIIDDDPMLLKLLGTHLTTAGYEVIAATNGAEGLAALRGGEARIAFVDYDMPGINGVEFCRQARMDAGISFTHLVILTAHADRALTIAALDAGANDFMTKPFHRGELLARLRAGERTVRLHDEAAQAARLESERNHLRDAVDAIQQVVDDVAADLRTPIASLRFLCDFLNNPRARGSAQWETSLLQMKDGIDRLASTLDGLLEVAKPNAAQIGADPPTDAKKSGALP